MREKDLFQDPDIVSFMTVEVVVDERANSPADGVCVVTHATVLLSLFIQIAIK